MNRSFLRLGVAFVAVLSLPLFLSSRPVAAAIRT